MLYEASSGMFEFV